MLRKLIFTVHVTFSFLWQEKREKGISWSSFRLSSLLSNLIINNPSQWKLSWVKFHYMQCRATSTNNVPFVRALIKKCKYSGFWHCSKLKNRFCLLYLSLRKHIFTNVAFLNFSQISIVWIFASVSELTVLSERNQYSFHS